MDLTELHRRCVGAWTDRLAAVPADRWEAPTPCRAWDVRGLVDHVVGEDLWTVPLVGGATLDEVGDRFDGDVLGDAPVASGRDAAAGAVRAVADAVAADPDGTVHLSYGEERLEEYVRQLCADHLVHAWDLAVATRTDTRLDPGAVEEVAGWFADREAAYREAGLVGPRVGGPPGDAQAALLSAFGRDPAWGPDHALLARFSAAFGRGDVDAIMALMTDDVVFESTGPAPDGVRHEGASAVRRVWVELFGGTRDPAFTEEESFVAGNRAVLRWRFEWTNDDGSAGHVRGTDVMRFRDGRVSEKLSYVKG